jgi:hypothetical protein
MAVEAIATVIAAGFAGWILFVEIPKMKRESAGKKVESVEIIGGENGCELHYYH